MLFQKMTEAAVTAICAEINEALAACVAANVSQNKPFYKVGCVFPMVIPPEIRMAHAAWGSKEAMTIGKTRRLYYLFNIPYIIYAIKIDEFIKFSD